jgi:Asp/Glu/hydantoin racemase
MRVLYMLPAAQGVYPKEAEERRLNLMRSYSSPGVEIEARYMPQVSGFSPWGGTGNVDTGELAAAHAQGAAMAQQAEREGFDAYCPYGLLDIGVLEARRRGVTIPCIGQAEAAALFCGFLGRRFASCSYMPGGEARIRAHVESLGLGHLLVASTTIGIPNSEYPQRRQEVLQNFVRCTQEARAAGAEIMGYIAMSICPGEFPARELQEASGFPVLDALANQLGFAEWWHRTGLSPSLLQVPR